MLVTPTAARTVVTAIPLVRAKSADDSKESKPKDSLDEKLNTE